jgi:hypothetical protein
MKIKSVLFLLGTLTVLFAACTTTIPVTYTEAAHLDMSGINQVAVESNNAQVADAISQQLSATGKYTVATAELQQWRAGVAQQQAAQQQWETGRQARLQQWEAERQAKRQFRESETKYLASAIEISAANLATAYQANVARADSSYKGKILKIAGTVKELGQTSRGSYFMRLAAGSDSVDFYFRPSELEKYKSVDKGRNVTIFGECSGRNLPNMEDTAEILRLLGAGSSVNISDARFPFVVDDDVVVDFVDVERPTDYPDHAVDALISANTHISTEDDSYTGSRAARDANGNNIKGADGKIIYQDVIVYTRRVTVDITYQITRLRDGSLIGQGTTTSASSRRASDEDKSKLPSPAELAAQIIDKPLKELISELVPTQRSVRMTLAKDESNAKGAKEAKKEMSEAQNLVKAKNYNAAATAYGKIYAQYDNFAAGYNQAVLMETAEGTGAAIVLMEALANKTGNSLAQNTLQQMQSRNASNQRAAEQLAQ